MSNNSKMDTATVFLIVEEINGKLDKLPKQQVEPVQVDLSAINDLSERLENMIEEVKKPTIVENHNLYSIDFDIRANWFFLSWIVLFIIVAGMFWVFANQQQTMSQYIDNDLKYRYVKMQGQTNEENLYRLENQFRYSDSIKIIHKQVTKYEDLVKEQAENMERARRNSDEAERLKKEVEQLKN